MPPKPYAKFPLTPHASGKWMKKINGELYYFGNWGRRVNGKLERVPGDGWEAALKEYEAQAADLHAGRVPQASADEKFTVKELCNAFLTAMYKRLQAGKKMSPRMFAEYRKTAEWLSTELGKNRQVAGLRPADFAALGYEIAKGYGVVRQANEIQKVKTIFKWGATNELIAREPNYGSEFKKPDKSEMREHRNSQAKKLFTRGELRQLLDAAGPQVRAMILLGINCGFGNGDCGALSRSALDLEGAMLSFPRPKTKVQRRCALWPETCDALRAALAQRPKAKDAADADCVFITKQGNRWVRDRVSKRDPKGDDDYSNKKVVAINSVGLEFGKRLRALHINGRAGLGFYSLRHTFRTIADATKDFPAVRLIMGHADNSIDAVYREQIDDDRLQAVAAYVRAWLFGDAVK